MGQLCSSDLNKVDHNDSNTQGVPSSHPMDDDDNAPLVKKKKRKKKKKKKRKKKDKQGGNKVSDASTIGKKMDSLPTIQNGSEKKSDSIENDDRENEESPLIPTNPTDIDKDDLGAGTMPQEPMIKEKEESIKESSNMVTNEMKDDTENREKSPPSSSSPFHFNANEILSPLAEKGFIPDEKESYTLENEMKDPSSASSSSSSSPSNPHSFTSGLRAGMKIAFERALLNQEENDPMNLSSPEHSIEIPLNFLNVTGIPKISEDIPDENDDEPPPLEVIKEPLIMNETETALLDDLKETEPIPPPLMDKPTDEGEEKVMIVDIFSQGPDRVGCQMKRIRPSEESDESDLDDEEKAEYHRRLSKLEKLPSSKTWQEMEAIFDKMERLGTELDSGQMNGSVTSPTESGSIQSSTSSTSLHTEESTTIRSPSSEDPPRSPKESDDDDRVSPIEIHNDDPDDPGPSSSSSSNQHGPIRYSLSQLSPIAEEPIIAGLKEENDEDSIITLSSPSPGHDNDGDSMSDSLSHSRSRSHSPSPSPASTVSSESGSYEESAVTSVNSLSADELRRLSTVIIHPSPHEEKINESVIPDQSSSSSSSATSPQMEILPVSPDTESPSKKIYLDHAALRHLNDEMNDMKIPMVNG